MPETFFLHVGTMKSGTTTLQAIAEASEEQLLAAGVGFPFGIPHDVNRRRFMLRIRRMMANPTKRAKNIQYFSKAIARTPQERALFSAERLAELPSEAIAGLAEAARETDLQIIITARGPARQVPSHWQQASKVANLPSYAEYCDEITDPGTETSRTFTARYDPVDIATRWGEVVGPDKIHLVILPRKGGDDSWLPDAFFGLIGVDVDSLDLTEPHRNVSMGYAEAELVRRLIEGMREKDDLHTHEILRFVGRWLTPTKAGAGDRIGITESTLAWCQAQADRQISQIRAADWHVIGDLEDLRPSPDTPFFVEHRDPEKDLAIATEYLERFMRAEIDVDRKRRRKLRAQRKRKRAARKQQRAAKVKPTLPQRVRSRAGRLVRSAIPGR
jgi:hypothetical protein